MSADETTSTDLVVFSSRQPGAVERLREELATFDWSEVAEVVEDPAQIQREIMTELLFAESDDDLLNRADAVGLRDLARRFVRHHGLAPQEGTPLVLHEPLRWRRSKFEESSIPYYLVCPATRMDTGERIVVTTGSVNVLAQLVNMAVRGTLEGARVLCTETETEAQSGNYPMWLIKTPQHMIPAHAREELEAEAEA